MGLPDHIWTLYLTIWGTAKRFPGWLTILHSPQRYMSITISPHPCQNLLLSDFLIITNHAAAAAAAAKSLQSCLTQCDPIDGSPLGSSVPGILQARTLEWVAISFSNAWKWKVKVKSLSRARLFATSWTGAYQAPPSIGFSRHEYWSGVPLPSPTNHASEHEVASHCDFVLNFPNN